MPYCPQCRAEYPEGIATCHACETLLLPGPREERPPDGPVGEWRGGRPLGAPFARGLHYAAEALRLLCRHPGLLLLPLLVTIFGTAERVTGQQLILRLFASRSMAELRAFAEARAQTPPSPGHALAADAVSAMDRFRVAAPAPELSGTRTVLAAYAPPRVGGGLLPVPTHASQWLSLALGLPLLVLPMGLFLAGYYGMLRRTLAGHSGRGAFWPSVKENAVVFLAYLSLLYLLRWAPGAAASPPAGPGHLGATFYGRLTDWGLPALLLLSGLGLVALIWERGGVLRALRRSAHTVRRDLPVCLLLLLPVFAMVVALRLLPARIGRDLIRHTADPHVSSAWPIAGLILIGLAACAVSAAVSVWLALAQLLWYHDANPVPAAPPAPTPTDTPADLTPQTP